MHLCNEILLDQIETDGNPVRPVEDSIETHRVPINPGDVHQEAYRLLTFKNFPRTSPVNPPALAARGFYYTGVRDCVTCFSCHLSVELWLKNDDVNSRSLHSQDCDFINGRYTGNVAIPKQRNTWSRFPRVCSDVIPETSTAQSASVSRRSQADVVVHRAGTDVTNSSSPRTSGLSPLQPRHSFSSSSAVPAPRFSEVRNSSSTTPQERRNTVSSTDLSALFPCLHPIHPEMRTYEARLQTFFRNPGLWPQHRITATPQDIAAAGMYFLGERDRTQCWYCNGGLQNWDRDDDPWEEHAKWYPTCEFVHQQRGTEFVRAIKAQHPNLRRPVPQIPPVAPTLSPITPGPSPVAPTLSPVTPAFSPVTPAFSPVTPALSPVTPAFSPVTSALSPVTPALSPVTPALSPVTHVLSPVTPAFSPVTSAISPVTPALSPVTHALSPVTSAPPSSQSFSGYWPRPLSATTSASSSGGPEIVDPREELRLRKQKIEEDLVSSVIVSDARQMGFEDKAIKAALMRQYELNNQGFTTLGAMVDVILSFSEDGSDEETSLPPVSSAISDINELENLEKSRRCQVCHHNLLEVVFIPCGHYVCCEECGRTTDACPTCQSSISERIRGSRT